MRAKDRTKGGYPLRTYFAPAQRASDDKLRQDIEFVNKKPIISGLMNIVSGLLAVVNEERQIVALNDALLDVLGVGDAAEILGLRLGEAVGCVHAHDMPGGCGTGEYCITCGAAIAQVAGLYRDRPEERTCAATVHKDGETQDLYFY